MGLGFTARLPYTQENKEQLQNFFLEQPSIVPGWETDSAVFDDGFRLTLVPFEEDIYGEWEPGYLKLSAKTNSAGPGYHAYLIGLLDDLQDKLGIVPHADMDDETGYYDHGDYARLQKSMADWLVSLSDLLIREYSNGEYSALSVSLATKDAPDATDHFTCCPLGYFEQEFFHRAAGGEDVSSEFFVWWNRARDAVFYKNVAQHLICCAMNFLPPQTEEEEELAGCVKACLARAHELDPALALPSPEDETLGFRRGNVNSLVYGWRVKRPGQMHHRIDDNDAYIWWDDARTIRASSLQFNVKEGAAADNNAILQHVIGKDDYVPFALRSNEIAAAISHEQIEENGEPLQQMRLLAVKDCKLLILSIYYTDEADKDWAEAVCASVAM